MNVSYYDKYLKYKHKYIKLKNIQDGGFNDITYIKSCKGVIPVIINGKKYDVTTVEKIREKTIYDIMNSNTYKYKYENFAHFYQININLNNIITATPHNDIIKMNKKMYICPVNKDNYKLLPKNESTYVIIISEGEREKHKEFIYEDNDIIIAPNITYNIMSDHDKIKFNNIKNDKSVEQMYKFLYNIHFVCFMKNNKYNTIFDLTMEYLTNIKTKIINYINKFYFIPIGHKFDDRKLKIFVSESFDRSRIYFKFNIFDVYNASFYKSYIFTTTTIDLDELIMMIDNKNISYNAKIPENIANEFCKGTNIMYDIEKTENKQQICKPVMTESVITQNIFQTVDKPFDFIKTNINNLEIISEYHKGNPDHSYCSEFYLISVSDNYSNKYFEFSIKSITFDVESNNKLFSNAYINKLNDIIKKEPYIKTDYELYFVDMLPAHLEIRIKEINPATYDMIYYDYHLQTSDEYFNKVLPKIKTAQISTYFIISFLYYSCKEKNINTEFTNSVDNNKYLQTKISDCSIHKDNYVIFYTNNIYYIEYVPMSLALYNDKLSEFCEEINKRQTEDLIQKWDVTKYSNFYVLYNDKSFKHNIRHVNKDDRIIIYNLLINYFTTKNTPPIIGNLLILTHYPLSLQNSVLHIYVYSTEQYKSAIWKDANLRYIDTSSTRAIYLNFNTDLDYEKQDMLVTNTVFVKLNEYMNMTKQDRKNKSIKNYNEKFGIDITDSQYTLF